MELHSCHTGLQNRSVAHASCSSRVTPVVTRHRAQQRAQSRSQQQCCRALNSRSQLWTPDQPEDVFEEEEDFADDMEVPSGYQGLSREQIGLMGLQPGLKRLGKEPDPASLSASNYYGGIYPMNEYGQPVTKGSALETRMAARGSAFGRRSKPPDLPSKLLDARIVYIGMPFTPKVTELVLAQLFFLSIDRANKPINVYVHSFGTQTPNKQAVSFETDAYAIIDTFRWIEPKIFTLVIGEAFGNAALIVAAGEKGARVISPNARMMTCPPRMNRSYGTTKSMMIRANDLDSNMQTYSRYMSRFTGRDYETVRKDMSRNRYFTAQQAVDYGLVDRVLAPDDKQTLELQAAEQKQRNLMLERQRAVKQQEAQQRELVGAGAGGGDGPDTGF